jgi:hypothetical protein
MRSTRNLVSSPDPITLHELDQIESNRKHQANVRTAEYMAANVIFAHYLSRGFRALNVGISRFIFFPLSLLLSGLEIGLVFNQARMEYKSTGRLKMGTVAKLVVESLGFAAAAIAIIGGMVNPALFIAVITPALLVASVGLKALFDFGSAVLDMAKNWVKPTVQVEPTLDAQERNANIYNAGRKFVSGLVNSAITVAMAFVAFTGFPLVYALALGVGGSVVGAVLHAKTADRSSKATFVNVVEPEELKDEEDASLLASSSPSSTARLVSRLDIAYGLIPATQVAVVSSSSRVLSSTSTTYTGPQATRTLPESVHTGNVVPIQPLKTGHDSDDRSASSTFSSRP